MYQKPVSLVTGMDLEYKVLVTGFEPFGGHVTNISQTVASTMEGRRKLACPWDGSTLDVVVDVDILPVDSRGAHRTAERLRKGEAWDAVLHVGLCETCEQPRIERLARDKLHMRLPDNAGRQVTDATIDDAGDRGCWVDPTVWEAEAFPTSYTVSTDAGAYLCNETYHATLKAVCEVGPSQPLPSPVLFLHLPGERHLPLETAEAFADACLAHLLHPYPEPVVHVVAAAVRANEGYLVTRRNSDQADAGLWEFPGGKCDPGESWSHAIVRELQEELNLEVIPLHPIGSWYRSTGHDAFAIHLVACTPVALDEPSLSVHDAFDWLSATSSLQRPWAGRDGEMSDYLQHRVKPMSSTHRLHPSNVRR